MTNLVICRICRVYPAQSRHHLIPRELGGKTTIFVCCDCHVWLHKHFTNIELAQQLHTEELIDSHAFVLGRRKEVELYERERERQYIQKTYKGCINLGELFPDFFNELSGATEPERTPDAC